MAEVVRIERGGQGKRGAHPILVIVCLLAITLVGCGVTSAPTDSARLTDGLADGSTREGARSGGLQFIADDGLECSADPGNLFDLEAAAATPTLLANLEVGSLGPEGANRMAADLASLEGSFCMAELLPETQAVLDEAKQLADSGRTDKALDLLYEHISDLQSATMGGLKLAAPSRDHAAKERRKIRSLLTMAARAQKYGEPGSDEVFFDAASLVIEKMAERDLPNATAKEALLIAMESQILGLEDLSTDALERAAEVFDMELQQALAAFDPCSVNEDAIQDLLLRAARVQATSADNENVTTALELFVESRSVLSRRARGEEVPECGEPAAIEWGQVHNDGWVSSGSAWTCDGEVWHLDLTLELTLPNGDFYMSGMLDFEVIDDMSGKHDIPMEGTLEAQLGALSGSAVLEDTINFDLTLDEGGKSGRITLASTGAGTITYEAGEVEEFGAIRPGGPDIKVVLHPYEGCGSQ